MCNYFNFYISNNITSKYRAKLVELKGKNTNPQSNGRIQYASLNYWWNKQTKKKSSEEIKGFNNIEKPGLTDIFNCTERINMVCYCAINMSLKFEGLW